MTLAMHGLAVARGVAIGRAFFGESMFHRVRDASKLALVALCERLREQGFGFFAQLAHELQ